MNETGQLFDTLMSGLAAGAAVIGGLVFWRSRLADNIRLPFTLTCACAVCWMISGGPLAEAIAAQSAIVTAILVTVGGGTVGFFWLSVRALFEDRPLTPLGFAPAGLSMAATLLALFTAVQTDWGFAVWWGWIVLSFLLVAHALVVVGRGWRGDLVEGRRRLRWPLLALCALTAGQVLGVLAVNALFEAGHGGEWMIHAMWASLALLAGLFALLFDARRSVFSPAPVRSSRDGAREDAEQLAALERLMTRDRFWSREGLSIAELAAELALPEYRLRRLINGHLGHRNFAAFVNAYRIEAATQRLADPAEARKTIAEIAFDLGFTSLNPFNRAFKETTGLTPTEWRRGRMLVETGKAAGLSKVDETPRDDQARGAAGTSPDRVH